MISMVIYLPGDVPTGVVPYLAIQNATRLPVDFCMSTIKPESHFKRRRDQIRLNWSSNIASARTTELSFSFHQPKPIFLHCFQRSATPYTPYYACDFTRIALASVIRPSASVLTYFIGVQLQNKSWRGEVSNPFYNLLPNFIFPVGLGCAFVQPRLYTASMSLLLVL